MRGDGPAVRALSRLDADIVQRLAGRDRATLAFSGGLGSLVMAALARKRCELRCVVVGLRGSADVEASRVAQKFLDYPVAVLRPSPRQAVGAARRIRSDNPRLPVPEVFGLVPFALVEGRYSSDCVLSGLGLTARSVTMRKALEAFPGASPGLRLRFPRSTRLPLLQMAEAIGLPESFVRAAPRSPLEGSAIGPALREMARSRGTTVSRLLGDDDLRSDNQEGRPRTVIPKSLDVD